LNWFEVITIIALFLGGLWALIVFGLNMKRTHDQEIAELQKESIDDLKKTLEKYQIAFLGLEKDMTAKFHAHELKIQSFEHSLKATTEAVTQTRNDLGKIYSNFKDTVEKTIRTTVKEIAPGTFRVGQENERKRS
jgi:CII-binding regulator of phage lambda lysogenization HflD